jgi:probable HAF family extracellular repeat protein
MLAATSAARLRSQRAPSSAAALVGWFLCSSALSAATFTGIGDLPGGSFDSHATGISAVGGVIVGDSNSTSGFEAVRWTASGGLVGLGDLPGSSFSSLANAVSPDGSVVVGRGQSATGQHAFRWSATTGMVDLGKLDGGGTGSVALGVSANGAVVVGNSDSTPGLQAFMWTAATGMVGLGDLPGGTFQSVANGVSASGQVIVGQSRSAAGSEAIRWTATGGMQSLGDLPGGIVLSSALAASADGSVIVGFGNNSAGRTEAFRWTAAGGMQPLGDLPGGNFFSVANAVSADGLTVVGRSNIGPTGLDDAAFVWDQAHGMRNLRSVLTNDFGLNLTGWTLSAATGVNGDGTQIIGFGTNPLGGPEAWIADLSASTAAVPEPSSLMIWTFAAFALSCRVRRRIQVYPCCSTVSRPCYPRMLHFSDAGWPRVARNLGQEEAFGGRSLRTSAAGWPRVARNLGQEEAFGGGLRPSARASQARHLQSGHVSGTPTDCWRRYQRAELHGHCSARSTKPARTGFRCM